MDSYECPSLHETSPNTVRVSETWDEFVYAVVTVSSNFVIYVALKTRLATYAHPIYMRYIPEKTYPIL